MIAKTSLARFHQDDRRWGAFDVFGDNTRRIRDVNVVHIPRAGTIVAWHRHRIQTDFWYVAQGCLQVGLAETAERSLPFDRHTRYVKEYEWVYLSPQSQLVLEIRPTFWHGYKSVEDNTILIYGLTEEYNPQDEERAKIEELGIQWNLGAR